MKYSDLKEEKKLWRKGYRRVVCLDEVGRGALAGPVIACAVITKISNFQFPISKQIPNSKYQISKIRDSKKLSPKARETFYKLLTKSPAIEWGIGRVSEKVIDKINILEATKLAMKKAINNLESKVDFLIIDGDFKINVNISQKSIIKADEKVFSCAAASIIAKVTRDRIMEIYHKKYPQYGFGGHKGYPTRYHREMIKKYERCQIHRKTFHLA